MKQLENYNNIILYNYVRKTPVLLGEAVYLPLTFGSNANYLNVI